MKYYTRRSMLKKGIQGLLWAATAGLSKISTAATADTAPHAENPHRWPGWGNGEYKKPLVIIHDGAIEEFMAIPLAVSLPDYALKTVIVMNADCIGYTAVQITDKILFRLRHNLTKRRSPLCFLSDLRPWNPFPWVYRAESSMADYLPQLTGLPSPKVKGITAEKLKRYIKKLARFERNPVTILNLCPLTTVADMLRLAGDPSLFEFDSDRSVTVTKNYDSDTGTYRSPDTSGTTRSVPGGTVKIAMGFAPGKDRDAFLIYYSEQLKHLAWS